MQADPPAAAAGGSRPWESPERPRPRYRGVKWATEFTGVGRRTIQRRVDAWLDPEDLDRGSYGIRGSQRPNPRGDRLIDPVDAERVRLQELGILDASVTTEQWDLMIAEGRVGQAVPLPSVTQEPWFQALLA